MILERIQVIGCDLTEEAEEYLESIDVWTHNTNFNSGDLRWKLPN